MHLIIHMFLTLVMPNISSYHYLNPNLYTLSNICVSFAVQYIGDDQFHRLASFCIFLVGATVKAQTSLHIGSLTSTLAGSPEPTPYAYTKCGSICKSGQNEMVSFI